ncbi:uncharacterized protein BDZ99DRAFT_565561 [Mytilinidion resinicola]|uniref:PD-(D/E)XK nuclease-like domain-containing protein n=1 Tax=Mytilinidion resinicola TaxID=574789 RepID=A0A6A6Z5R2_9PEZI|nr:uncharacterized protein BDZ99DRAFT_565561 [Mytilinidion resinicola]KAF2815597.1 hypothetical protein BDZ99DRAFT_565561 [Mytilinidion resinicola]
MHSFLARAIANVLNEETIGPNGSEKKTPTRYPKSRNPCDAHLEQGTISPMPKSLAVAFEMSPECVPGSTLPTRFKDLDKKIDLAIGLQLHHITKAALCTEQAKTEEPSKAINQASTFIHQNPRLLSIEVKRTYGGTDPIIQLAAWSPSSSLSARSKK